MIDIKKNPRAVIENYSKIFFQIGLVLTLVIINFMMEYKTYDSDSSSRLGIVTMKEEMKEEMKASEFMYSKVLVNSDFGNVK